MVYECLRLSVWGCNVDYSVEEYLAYVSYSNNKWWKMSCRSPEKRFPLGDKEYECWWLIKLNKTQFLIGFCWCIMIFCVILVLLSCRHCSHPVCRGSWEALHSWYCDATAWIWCHLSHTQGWVRTHLHIFFSTLHDTIFFIVYDFSAFSCFRLGLSPFLMWSLDLIL